MEIAALPNEILGKIFWFLPAEDLQPTSMVCSSWWEVIRTFILSKHVAVHIKPVHPVTHQLLPMAQLLTEQMMLPVQKSHLKLTIPNEELPRTDEFSEYFKRCGPVLKSLNLQVLRLTDDILSVFSHLGNVQALTVTSESDSLYEKQPSNVHEALSALRSLRHLRLNLPSYAIIKNLGVPSSTPLVSLCFERFEMEIHQLKLILNVYSGTLRALTVRVEEMKPFLQLLNAYDDLNLRKLDIKSAGNEDDFSDAMIRMYERQPGLRNLRIGSELSLRAVEQLPVKLRQLETLEIIAESIHNCKAFSELRQLRKLTLCLYDVRAWDETVKLEHVTELSLSVTFPLCSSAIFCSFPSLRQFYLEDVDDESLMRDVIVVQTLLGQMQRIRILDLENYVLREREILHKDVPRFEVMQELQCLRYSCRDMSDASLLTFDLPHLRELYLTHCPSVTYKGIAYVGRNCPLIEKLHVEYNKHGFNDDCVELLTRKLTHLRNLSLVNLKQLSNQSLESIRTHCSVLRELSIVHCIAITLSKAEAIALLSTMSSLRNLVYS